MERESYQKRAIKRSRGSSEILEYFRFAGDIIEIKSVDELQISFIANFFKFGLERILDFYFLFFCKHIHT